MAKDKAVVDRRAELRDKLGGRELTPEKFVEIAFQNENVQRIDVFKMAEGTWNPTKVHTFEQGFDPTAVEAFLIEKHGNGRYRLSAVMDGEFAAHKSFAVGDPETVAPANIRGRRLVPVDPADLDETESRDTSADVSRAMTKTLREVALLRQGQDMIGDMESRALEREMKPAQMMMQMMGTMLEALKTKPAGNDQMMTVLVTMLTQSMQSQQALFMEMLKMKESRAGGAGEGMKALSEGLAQLEKVLSGRIGELIESRGDGESRGTDWAAIAQVAAPILERGMAIMEQGMRSRAPAPPRPVVARPIPSPEAATAAAPPQLTEGEPVQLHPDPEMDAALKEAAKMGVELLKSRDFEGLYALIDLNYPDLLAKINPAVGKKTPLIYTQMLKRLHPDFDKLREEFAGFCVWLEENAEGDEPDPAGEGRPGHEE